MKQTLLFLALAIFISLTSCKKIDLPGKTPDCVKTLIKKHEVVRVEKWEVDGETFYYTEADCCDQFNLLYDLNCAQICAPTGGFSGQGDGLCPQFNGTVVKTEIWSQD